MGIITISRGTRAGGILLAEELGHRLGFAVVSRDDLTEAEPRLQAVEEQLWEEMNSFPEYMWESLESLRHAYLCMLRSLLLDRAEAGPLIYHANGGQFLLNDIPGVLRIRLVAPLQMRIAMIGQHLDLKPIDATRYVHERDSRRDSWIRFLYGTRSLDQGLYYDLVINLERISVHEAASMVVTTAELPQFTWTDANRQQLHDAALGCRVEAALSENSNTRMLELHATAHGGTVTIHGDLPPGAALDEVESIARAVSGVETITVSGNG